MGAGVVVLWCWCGVGVPGVGWVCLVWGVVVGSAAGGGELLLIVWSESGLRVVVSLFYSGECGRVDLLRVVGVVWGVLGELLLIEAAGGDPGGGGGELLLIVGCGARAAGGVVVGVVGGGDPGAIIRK